jgi:PAS domain S-box-containing protein
MASNRKFGIARRIFYQLQQLSGDGSLADISARFSLHNPYAALRVREGLNAKYRSDLEKYGFAALALILLVVSIQNLRIRRARKAEEESQGRFDAFMKYSPAIQIVKHRDGRLLYVNEAYCRTFNKTSEEVLGKTNSEIWPPDVAEELRRSDEAASSSKQEWIQTLPSMAGSKDFLVLKFPISHSNKSWTGVVALDITESVLLNGRCASVSSPSRTQWRLLHGWIPRAASFMQTVLPPRAWVIRAKNFLP